MKVPTRIFGNCRKSITDSTESENKLTSVAADPTVLPFGWGVVRGITTGMGLGWTDVLNRGEEGVCKAVISNKI